MNSSCPVCGWKECAAYLEQGELSLVRCTQCLLVRRAPLPLQADIAALDQAVTVENPNEAISEQDAFRCKAIVANVENFVRSGHWIDVGCGSGTLLRVARDHGFAVHGVEKAPALARHAIEKHDIDVINGNVFEANFPTNAFDVVTLWHTLEHATAPLDLLDEVLRVLKPGGFLLLEVFNVVAARNLIGTKQPGAKFDDPRCALFFSPVTARSVVEKAGFLVQQVQSRSDAEYWPQAPLWKKATRGLLSRVGLPDLVGIVAQKP